MGYAILVGTLSFFGGAALVHFLINFQIRNRVGQPQKSYGVGIDTEVKEATPTLGGVAFVVIAIAALIVALAAALMGFRVSFFPEALFFWSLPIACGLIGFVDDWLKLSRKSSEGFSSLKKLAVQLVVASIWTFWAARLGVLAAWPGLHVPYWILFPLAILATAGMMNAVNITDGLDGLAGGAFLISLGVLACVFVFPVQEFWHSRFAVLFGMVTGFLFYNIHPARIFMGDAGSHFLGGALVAVCIGGGMVMALIPAGFIFVIELLSSAIQIVSIRRFNKKIFLMAPFHHHF